MVEMGGFVFCDECIDLAASIIAVRKGGAVAASGVSAPVFVCCFRAPTVAPFFYRLSKLLKKGAGVDSNLGLQLRRPRFIGRLELVAAPQ